MSTICLNMIVKNEATIIADTLANILQHIHIDHWVIVDTGSTDQTAEIIENFFAERQIKGSLVHHKWQNFGHNRQLALLEAQGQSDFVLFFDADDRFEGELSLPENLDQYDAYSFQMYHLGVILPRYLLVKNDGRFYWLGETHEVITPKQAIKTNHLIGDYRVLIGHFGARSQNPQKYEQDALNLVQSYEQEQNPDLKRRYAYFCEQSFYDCQRYGDAEKWLKIHINLCQPKTEEIRYAYIILALIYKQLPNQAEMVSAWLNAYEHAPLHAESLGLLAEYFCGQNCFQLAFDFAQKAVQLPAPIVDQCISVNDLLHRYGIFYHLALSAYHLRKKEVLFQANLHLYRQPELNEQLNLFIIEAFLHCNDEFEHLKQQQCLDISNKIEAWQKIDELTATKRSRLLERLSSYS